MQLNPDLNETPTVDRICEGYREGSGDINDDNFHIVHEPFKVLKLKNLCSNDDFMKQLTKEVKALTLHRKHNDLYSLWQSDDLARYAGENCISQFLATLRGDVGKLLSKVMNVDFNDNFTITASLYEEGDVLLCHDDKCTDRCVAFVYYLTGTGEEKGGAFEMFAKDDKGQPSTVVKSLPAISNSFVCFEVGNFTYHQVSEIEDPIFERLSLNGWFHSDRKISPYEYSDPMPPLLEPVDMLGSVFFDEFIDAVYLKPSSVKEAQAKFANDSEIMLENFIRSEMFNKCREELMRIPNWTTRGSANRRHYSIVENVEEPNLKKLISYLRTPDFFSYLGEMTGLTLSSEPDVDQNLARCTLEIQKWSPGDYTMVTDNDEFFNKFGLDLYLWFNISEIDLTLENGGTITYLAAGDKDDDEDEELLNVEPVDRALVLVYRMEDTVRFTKYLNRTTTGSYFCICASYYEDGETRCKGSSSNT